MDTSKLRKHTLETIANMICGNSPYGYFPYRSSSKLTNFFNDLDINYVHDGSTRLYWVLERLEELNKNSVNQKQVLSGELVRIIENLLDIRYFIEYFNENKSWFSEPDESTKMNYNKAINEVNNVLKHSNYEIVIDSNSFKVKVIALDSIFISSAVKDKNNIKKITFTPNVFSIPDIEVQENLVSVMMPFDKKFDQIYKSIINSCNHCNFECKRADDIWNNSIIIQDIFDLIYTSTIIIVDFTGKNPNVMYETGIAHTLGKIVIPITQAIDDVPFDLRHHRVLKYLPNNEGLAEFTTTLTQKLKNHLGSASSNSRNIVKENIYKDEKLQSQIYPIKNDDISEVWSKVLENIESLPAKMFFNALAYPIQVDSALVKLAFNNPSFARSAQEKAKITYFKKALQTTFNAIPEIVITTV